MMDNVIQHKKLPFCGVLKGARFGAMDTWYAKMEIMKKIERAGKVYYCPLQDNRQVNDSDGQRAYQRIESGPSEGPSTDVER